jgi:DNA primase
MGGFDVETIDVLDFFDCLEIDNVTQATDVEISFSCPYPGHAMGDSTPSAYMNMETTAFFCHACHAKGNAVHLTAHVLGVSMLEATRMLRQRYSPGGIDPDSRNYVVELRRWQERQEAKRSVKEAVNDVLDDGLLSPFLVDWFRAQKAVNEGKAPKSMRYMFERGFDAETLTQWEFGYDAISNRIVFPIRNEDGALVGFKARAFDDRRPKYLNLGGEQYGWRPFLKNSVVFGLDRARKSRHLIIVEGELNTVAMHMKGWNATVAINGSYFGPRQMRLIKKFADSVTLFFDSDKAGDHAVEALIEELSPFLTVFACGEHQGDPADMSKAEIHGCLSGAVSSTLRLLRSQHTGT